MDSSSGGAQDYLLQAEHLKSLGNEAYKSGDTTMAITYFTQAIDIDPDNHLLYSNRSASYLKADFISKALKDAEKCVLLQPKWLKGYNRLGIAQQLLCRFDDAVETFRKGLEIDPNDSSLWSAIRKCEEDKEKDKQFKKQEAIRQRDLEEERLRIVEENKRNIERIKREEAEAERLESDAAAAVSAPLEDDLLAGFFSDIQETEKEKKERERRKEVERLTAKEKEEELLKKQNEFFPVDEAAGLGTAAIAKKVEAAEDESTAQRLVTEKYTSQDLGSGKDQVDRLTGRHYEWKNLNPYYVLQLGTDATEEDIKYRYRKLSAKVHPDKLIGVENAREAFEQVKNAYSKVLDGNQRTLITLHMENIRKDVMRERKKLSITSVATANDGPNSSAAATTSSESIDEEVRNRTMKLFADMEMERRRAEKNIHSYTVHEKTLLEEEQDRLKKEYEFQKDWSKEERMGHRVGNWRDFQQDPTAAKKVKTGHFNKEVNTDKKKASTGASDDYKKSWR